MKRVGQKGEGKWQRISWDEALDTIATKWKQIIARDGAQAIANVYQDSPRTHFLPYALLNYAIGSPNTFGALHICYCPTIEAEMNTYGGFITHEHGPDFENSKCIFIWGANPVMTHPLSVAWHIFQGKRRGAKVVVVDPRFTETAAKADLWLQLRPATDAALALGMINVIINEGLYDKDFIGRWCIGFDELRARAQEYPPDKVAEITWVPKEKIIQAARMYANGPTAQYHRVAVEQHTNAWGTCQALSILVAITGNLDVPGGNIFTQRPKGYKAEPRIFANMLNSLPQEVRMKQVGVKEFPLFIGPGSQSSATPSPLAMKAILRGEIKSVFGVANLLLSGENAKHEVLPALKKLEFMWLADFFMTPTMEYCDIVLPAATWVEVDDLCDVSYGDKFGVRLKAIEPVGEAKDDKWIAIEIAKRMGVIDKFPGQPETVEDFLNWRLKDLGLTMNHFRQPGVKNYVTRPREYKKYEKSGHFLTPSGKVELASTKCKQLGLDAVPAYHEPHESFISTPELAKEYPLIGIFGVRHIAYFHSANRQIPWLCELHPEPTIEIHPDTAAKLSIKDGDWVWIKTPRAKDRVKQKAKLTLGIHPKIVCAEPFWWFPERGAPDYNCWESNINVLTSGDPPYDPVVGSTLIRGGLCKIYKVED